MLRPWIASKGWAFALLAVALSTTTFVLDATACSKTKHGGHKVNASPSSQRITQQTLLQGMTQTSLPVALWTELYQPARQSYIAASNTSGLINAGVSSEEFYHQKVFHLQGNESLVLVDDKLRIIGGDIEQARPPKIKLPFYLEASKVLNHAPRLSLGVVRGIHTPEAHALGQASHDHVSAPALLKVNGKKLKYLYTNSNHLEVPIPLSYLRKNGVNTITLEAGYYFPEENHIAYDQIQFQHVGVIY
jgi:hypothetical protein